MRLSLVVIARNEADRIGRCLDSVPADHKLVLDAGSIDDTREVARRHGAEVVAADWPGFVAQKNRGLDHAPGPWVVSLDADEWLDATAAVALRAAVDRDPVAGFGFVRQNRWLGRDLVAGRFAFERKVRVVLKGAGRWGGREPHDQLDVSGPVGWLPGRLLHDPYRSFAEHLATARRYADLSAEALVAEGARAGVWDVWGRPGWHLADALVVRGGWRDGWAGVAVAGVGAWSTARKWRGVRASGRR